jgi:hypothetical protein
MKKQFLFFLIFCSFTISITFAQVIEWQNNIGASGNDWLYSVQQTSDGGYILGGVSSSSLSGDKTENSNGGGDYWVIKTNDSGEIQWQNSIGGSGDDFLYCVQQTLDGGYILVGESSSNISGDKTENCYGWADYWVVKVDAGGVIQWQNTIGGDEYENIQSFVQTNDGGFVLGGTSQSGISGDKTEPNNGFSEYWIVKIDSVGNILWQNGIGGNAYNFLYSIENTSDNGFILGGMSTSNISGDKSENSLGDFDYWIVKTDSVGNVQWDNTIGGNLIDQLMSVKQAQDGGYVLGGFSRSTISGDKTEVCLGGPDYWIVKTDAAGNIEWQNTIGGSTIDEFYALEATYDGGFLLGGFSWSSISDDKTENSRGAADYWVLKIDSLGNILWQKTVGGNDGDELYAIDQTFDGGVILAGRSISPISGDKTENSIGVYDYWIVKLTDQFNSISGRAFGDLNSNLVQDFGEPDLTNLKITEQTTGRFSFSNQYGEYSLSTLDSGSFVVVPEALNSYIENPLTHSAYFSGIQQTDSLNDFAFQPQGVFNDLCVSIAPTGPFRSGFSATYMISYENVGTTSIAPTIIFFPDNNVSYSSSNLTPLTITPDSIVWNLGQLTPFQTGNILVSVLVNQGLTLGSLINSTVRIEPVNGDANPTCNYGAWEVFITGSYDPNDILVNEDTLTTTQLATEPFLEYIIRFQNTGNDTAFTVKILNLIDTLKLNLSSFEFVNASHNVELKWLPWERNMEFKFNNILLPDSNINEPLSHGFVRYRIQPKTSLVAGDSVTNNAAIYFDFNAPVLTNTAVTKIVLPTGLQALETKYDYIIYPNPTTGQVLLEVNATHLTNAQVSLHTIQGKMIKSESYTLKAGTNKLNLNTSDLSSGIYLVRMVIDGNSVVKKLVKM